MEQRNKISSLVDCCLSILCYLFSFDLHRSKKSFTATAIFCWLKKIEKKSCFEEGSLQNDRWEGWKGTPVVLRKGPCKTTGGMEGRTTGCFEEGSLQNDCGMEGRTKVLKISTYYIPTMY